MTRTFGKQEAYEEFVITMTWLLVNIPLMVGFVALWVGIPAWLVLKRPDARPEPAAAPAVRNLPARSEDVVRRREDVVRRRAA